MASWHEPQPLRDLRNPRAYFRSSNSDTLTVYSDTTDTRVTFYNSVTSTTTGVPNIVVSASNERLLILKDGADTLAAFDKTSAGAARLTVPGGDVVADRFTVAADAASGAQKSVVLRDYNPYSASNQFVGFGLGLGAADADLVYHVASNTAGHTFLVGDARVARIQQGPLGGAQVGIGATALGAGSPGSNAALDVQGDAHIAGRLTVSGPFTFDTSGLATLSDAGRVPAVQLPTGLVYTDSNAKLDPALFPAVPGSPLLRSARNVGIGTRFAHERLHVQGSAIVTERLGVGIGASSPAARLHLSESNAAIPVLRLDAAAGGPLLDARYLGANTLYISGTSNGANVGGFVGIGTTAPIPHAIGADGAIGAYGNGPIRLSVSGDVTTNGIIACSNIRTANLQLFDATLAAGLGAASNAPVLYKETLVATGPTLRSFIPLQQNAPLLANTLQSHGAAPYVHFQDSSVRVDGDLYLYGQTYVLSDAAVKADIAPITDPLRRLAALRGYTYRRTDAARDAAHAPPRAAGLLAQEVQTALPEAVARPDANGPQLVNYDAIVPLLVECIRALQEKITTLEREREPTSHESR